MVRPSSREGEVMESHGVLSFPKRLSCACSRLKIQRKGFRPVKLRLLTSLRDRKLYPAEKIISLQNAVGTPNSTSAPSDDHGQGHLSCKSRDIEREILIHMTRLQPRQGSHALRRNRIDVSPDRISFSRHGLRSRHG
jgi:hypothetical protein